MEERKERKIKERERCTVLMEFSTGIAIGIGQDSGALYSMEKLGYPCSMGFKTLVFTEIV